MDDTDGKGFEGWQLLSDGIIRHLFEFLGLDALNLRQVCRHFSKAGLPDGIALALKALKCEPNVPDLELHKSRTPAAACSMFEWESDRYHSGLSYRKEWASLVQLIDRAPINTVIDAFLLTPMKSGGSKHTQAVRAVLHKCIEARLWGLICGLDEIKTEPYTEMWVPMSDESVLHTVQRMFDPNVNVHNGPTSFFYTPYGWLGFTPFLLAAEQQNLPLVKYLHETCSPSITVDSKSQAGNNAYALSEAYLLQQLRRTPEEMEGSEMLQYLKPIVRTHEPKRDEYDVWEGILPRPPPVPPDAE